MSELAIDREIDRSHMKVTDEVAIQITNMNKWYGTFHVLRDINLTVNRGERIVICGIPFYNLEIKTKYLRDERNIYRSLLETISAIKDSPN